MNAAPPRVLLVTDPSYGDDIVARCVRRAAGALPPGAFCVQLRDKRRPVVGLRLFALELRRLTRDCGARLVVNGHARLARDVGADGVHLGGDAGSVGEARAVCGAEAWISVACHHDADVASAVASGADAVVVSPIFATTPPVFGAPAKLGRGPAALRSARALAGRGVGVLALGGVTVERAPACAQAGADGVAVMRALLASGDPARVARALHDAVSLRC